MLKGKCIVIEGQNGVGKTSVTKKLSYLTGIPLDNIISSSSFLDEIIPRKFAHSWNPHMRSAYYLVANQMVSDLSITLNGGGIQKRCFIYVDDVINALLKLNNSKVQGIFNIGNPKNHISIKELADIIVKLTKSKSNIQISPPISHDVSERIPNLDKIKLHTGWEPIVSLEEGLQKIIEFYIILKN